MSSTFGFIFVLMTIKFNTNYFGTNTMRLLHFTDYRFTTNYAGTNTMRVLVLIVHFFVVLTIDLLTTSLIL